MNNNLFICQYCEKSILESSRLMHQISCNQTNTTLFFCSKCDTYFNQYEESDHLIGHQIEDYSNFKTSNFMNNSVFNNQNNLPSNISNYDLNDNEQINNNLQSAQTEPTEFIIQDLSKIPFDKRQCAICLVDYICNEKVKILPCIHIFHSECVEKWLLKKKKCPLCNTKINPNESQSSSSNRLSISDDESQSNLEEDSLSSSEFLNEEEDQRYIHRRYNANQNHNRDSSKSSDST